MPRISLLAMLVLATLVAAGCGKYGERYTGDGESTVSAAGEEREITDEAFDAAARKADGCTEVEEFESEGSTHTTDPDEPVEYENNPPHSGDHYQIAAKWGLYDEPQPDVETVHSLEHGHLVISHKGLSKADRDELYDQARINPYHLLVQPRDDNPKDGVFYTAWTAQMFCETPSAAGLQHMIENWRDQGPELLTDDAGGVGLDEKDA